MLDEEHKEMLISLTENQAILLRTVFLESIPASGDSGLSGHGLGRVAGSLKEKGFITPMGKKDRQTKWDLTPTWKDNWKKNRKEIKTILDKIAGD